MHLIIYFLVLDIDSRYLNGLRASWFRSISSGSVKQRLAELFIQACLAPIRTDWDEYIGTAVSAQISNMADTFLSLRETHEKHGYLLHQAIPVLYVSFSSVLDHDTPGRE